MIRIKLDLLPPTVNEMYRRSRSSFYKSAEAKETCEAIQLLMRSQYRDKPLKESGISVSINLSCKNARRDIDGSIKSLFDCGNGILWSDDHLITELHVFKFRSTSDHLEMIIDGPSVVAEKEYPVRAVRTRA